MSQWENGHRSPGPAMVRRVAIALGFTPDEQDAMVGMWRAAGSVRALPPRAKWEHNYRPEADRVNDPTAEGGPAWIWFRCVPGQRAVSVSAGWAPWGEDFIVPATRSGMLASAPASLPNPPVQITFSTPGWADFGNGVVPEGITDALEMKTFAAMTWPRGRFADPPELDEAEEAKVKPYLKGMQWFSETRIHVLWQQVKPHLGAMRPSNKVQPLEGAKVLQTGWTETLRTDDRGELADQLLQTPEQIKRIRRIGRGMSAEAASQAVSAAEVAGEGDQITANQIETLERSGTLPKSARIIARLDHVYHLDGYLGIERVFSSATTKARVDKNGLWSIRFPDFWIGPVWLQFRAPEVPGKESAVGTLDLYWGRWRRLQLVGHGTVVTTRKAAASGEMLKVRLPQRWNLVAGTGAVPGAIDINHDWYPVSLRAAGEIFFDGFNTLKRAGRLPG